MKSKFAIFSIVLSTISICLTIKVNYELWVRYMSITWGKTRALFGLTELLEFGYQNYYAIFGIVSLLLLVISIRRSEKRALIISSVMLAIFSIIAVFSGFWKLFI